MRYNSLTNLYPPRPEIAIHPKLLHFYEAKSWIAQYKKNGSNCVIWISPEKEITIKNRHMQDQSWSMPHSLKEKLLSFFPEDEWFVLCTELMHLKTPDIKDTLYIHDALVWKSEFLLSSTFLQRQSLLEERFKTNVETQSHYLCDTGGKLWYAKYFNKNFNSIFQNLKDSKVDEGLVLKDPEAKLHFCDKEKSNCTWQVKCRVESKSYNF